MELLSSVNAKRIYLISKPALHIILWIYLFFLITKGEELFCFTCLSYKHENCSDPFVVSKRKNYYNNCLNSGEGLNELLEILSMDGSYCNDAYNCAKVIMKTDTMSQDTTIRLCSGPHNSEYDICHILYEIYEETAATKLDIRHCSLCNENGCNAGSTIQNDQLIFYLILTTISVVASN